MRTAPPIHLRLRAARPDESGVRLALRAALSAAHLLGLAAGTHLRRLRDHTDPLLCLQARLDEAELRARLATRVNDLLLARFARLPERRRPHYTPAQRFAILEIRSLLAWSAPDTARAFLLSTNTILNWDRTANPEARTVGATVMPAPPVRRAADVVRSTVKLLTRLGFGGSDQIARVLARAGWKLSARSVGRYRRERPHPLLPEPQRTSSPRQPHPVVTRFVHHVWMLDVSQVHRWLGPDIFLAAVFEAHSRVPLILQGFPRRPCGAGMASLLRRATRAFAPPRYVITDLGGEFTSGVFRKTVQRLGAVQRFASADNLHATARMERFWRTLKEAAQLRRLQLPLTQDDLERRLAPVLAHYLAFRPHEGLGGATPFEVFLGLEPAHAAAVPPPRGRPGEPVPLAPFRVDFLDPQARQLPYLRTAA